MTEPVPQAWDPAAFPPGGGALRRVDHETRGGLLVELVVDQPEARNALSPGMMAQLADHVADLLVQPPRGVLLRGEGTRAFCSGGDLRSVRKHLIDKEAGAGMCRTMGRLLDRLFAAPFPVVGAVEGAALGGGAELLSCCHIVFAGRGAKVGFVHAALGVSPGWGGGRRLVARVGSQVAARVLLEARAWSAEQARELGLVDVVTEDGGAAAGALEWLEGVARLPPDAAQAALLIARGATREQEEAAFAGLWGSPEHRRRLDRAMSKGKS